MKKVNNLYSFLYIMTKIKHYKKKSDKRQTKIYC